MKLLTVAGLVLMTTITGVGQNTQALNASSDKITLSAEHEIKQGGLVKLRGHVEVITDSVAVYADEGDYDPITGDFEAHGSVRINFKQTTRIKIQQSSPEDLPLLKFK